jgi:hypothetical protein
VRAIADAAHAGHALLLVDAAQSVGAVRCDVKELGIDALAVAAQKNLLAFYGLGFLFVRKALAESLIPAHLARYGIDMGTEAGETARTGGEDLPYAGARSSTWAITITWALRPRRSRAAHRPSACPHRSAPEALASRLANGLLALACRAGGPPARTWDTSWRWVKAAVGITIPPTTRR